MWILWKKKEGENRCCHRYGIIPAAMDRNPAIRLDDVVFVLVMIEALCPVDDVLTSRYDDASATVKISSARHWRPAHLQSQTNIPATDQDQPGDGCVRCIRNALHCSHRHFCLPFKLYFFFLFISVSFSFKSKKMERQEYAEMFLNWLNFCSFLRWWGSCVSGGWVHCHSFMLLAAVRLISRPMKLKPSPGAIQSNRIWPPFLPTPFWLLCKFMLIGRTQRRQRVPPALYVPWSDQTSHFQRKWDESMKYSSENHSPRPLARTLRAKLNYWLKINAFHFHLQLIQIHSQTTHYFYQIISFLISNSDANLKTFSFN